MEMFPLSNCLLITSNFRLNKKRLQNTVNSDGCKRRAINKIIIKFNQNDQNKKAEKTETMIAANHYPIRQRVRLALAHSN